MLWVLIETGHLSSFYYVQVARFEKYIRYTGDICSGKVFQWFSHVTNYSYNFLVT